jgi:hypothetical protein
MRTRPLGRHRSAQLLPGPWPHRDAVGDRVAKQVIQRASLCVRREPRILEVALNQTVTFQRAADASGELLDQRKRITCATLRQISTDHF